MNGFTIVRAGAMTMLSILMIAGCGDSTTEPPEAVPYTGSIEGIGDFTAVTGTASLEVLSTAIDVAIAMENAPEVDEAGFPWILREGTCAEPGDEVGDLADYPGIVLDGEGEWEGTLDFSPDEVEGLLLDVRRSNSESETRLACAVLEPAGD